MHTDGVIRLSAFTANDVSTVLGADMDVEHRRWFEIPADFVPTPEHAQRVIDVWRHRLTSGRAPVYAARRCVDDVLVAGCDLQPDAWGVRLSYWTYPGFRRTGYGVRVARLATAAAYDDLHASRVYVEIARANIASLRTAARAGFRVAPSPRDDASDTLCWHEVARAGKTVGGAETSWASASDAHIDTPPS
ncbi:MAG: GNAT family N-acetyltransferase [Gemmatimonadaceae bacterium]|jgi:RimJ/RimL family protein N-acetyltransferase|nr:GNAT family N-acetyltransferase [Gemmatimonadaceae bacterium]